MTQVASMSVGRQQQAVAMARRYQQHLNGYAYIPLQDMVKYEQAYRLVYGK